MVKIEDILFWILILTVIGMAIWLAFGSPDFEDSLLMIIIFVASSMILLWKALFSIDKKTALGFERVNLNFKRVNEKLENMENKLINIESLIKKK